MGCLTVAGINWYQVLAGALAGLVVAVVLVDPLKAIRNMAFTRARRMVRNLRRTLSVGNPRNDLFRFGTVTTSWYVREGDGRAPFRAVTCELLQADLQLPDELAELRQRISEEQVDLQTKGKQHLWNGPMLALDSYTRDRIGSQEHVTLHLLVRPCDYYSFLATSLSLDHVLADGQTVRSKYLGEHDWGLKTPAESLSTSLGINVAIITRDNKIIVVRRGRDVGSMPGAWGASINEGLNGADDSPSGPDVQLCGRRGALEELGLDLPTENIHFLSLGVDTRLAQWGLLGMARTTLTYEQVLQARAVGVKDKFEADRVCGLEFTTKAVAEFVSTNMNWTPGGLACVYHALVSVYGVREVSRTLGRMGRGAAGQTSVAP